MSDTQVIARPVVNRIIVRSPGPPGPPGSSELTGLDLAQLRDATALATVASGQGIVRQGNAWVPGDFTTSQELDAALDDKADASALAAKANTSDVNAALAAKVDVTALTTGLASKANTTDLNTGLAAKADAAGTTAALNTKADANTVNSALAAKANTTDLNTGLAGKVSTTDPRLTDKRVSPDNSVTPAQLTFDPATQAELDAHTARLDNPHATTKAQVGLGNVDNTSDAAKPISTATAAALAAKADLVAGKIPSSQLPAVAIGESFPVASQVEMLALTAQQGDVAVRTDQANTKYMLLGSDPTVLANWSAFTSPSASGVASVNGQAGVVVLGKADIGLGNVDNTADADKPVSTAQASALAGKQNADADLTTISSLDSATAGVISSDGAGWLRKSYAQLKTALGLTKADVGLGNVDNTADAAKPISSATQTALNAKQDADADLAAIAGLDSTIAGVLSTTGNGWIRQTYAQVKTALGLTKADVGLGNVDNTSDTAKPVSTATQAALDAKQPLDADLTTIAALDATTAGVLSTDGSGWIRKSYAQVKTALGLTKADVGLGNVDNTADTAKPISAATQTALDAKAATAAGMPTGGNTGQVLAKTGNGDYAAGWTTPSAGESDLSSLLRPAGTFRETFSRLFSTQANTVADARIGGTAVVFHAGEVVTGISLQKNAASSGMTHCRYMIGTLSSDWQTFTVLAVTVDDTTAAAAASTSRRLALTTPWTCPATGVYYVAVANTGTTVGTWYGAGIPSGSVESPRIGFYSGASAVNATSLPTIAAGSTIALGGNSQIHSLYAAFD